MEFKKHLTFAAYHHYIVSQLNITIGASVVFTQGCENVQGGDFLPFDLVLGLDQWAGK